MLEEHLLQTVREVLLHLSLNHHSPYLVVQVAYPVVQVAYPVVPVAYPVVPVASPEVQVASQEVLVASLLEYLQMRL